MIRRACPTGHYVTIDPVKWVCPFCGKPLAPAKEADR